MGLVSFIRTQWDRVGAWACIVAGAVALLAGWFGVSGTDLTYEQIPYVVSGGLVGLFLLGLAALLWLSADLRDEWRKLAAIDRHLIGTGGLPGQGDGHTPGAERPNEGSTPGHEGVVPQEISLR